MMLQTTIMLKTVTMARCSAQHVLDHIESETEEQAMPQTCRIQSTVNLPKHKCEGWERRSKNKGDIRVWKFWRRIQMLNMSCSEAKWKNRQESSSSDWWIILILMRKDASRREEERLYLADLHRRLGKGSNPKVKDIMKIKNQVTIHITPVSFPGGSSCERCWAIFGKQGEVLDGVGLGLSYCEIHDPSIVYNKTKFAFLGRL